MLPFVWPNACVDHPCTVCLKSLILQDLFWHLESFRLAVLFAFMPISNDLPRIGLLTRRVPAGKPLLYVYFFLVPVVSADSLAVALAY